MSAALWLLAAACWAQTALLADNMRRFRPPAPAGGAGGPPPRVSVLVPARDEAPRIGRLVASVLAQDAGLHELIVLDDRSSDGTAEAARRAAFGDSRLRVVAGAAPPAGWAGKPHACHQLAESATGDWWLFLDADTALAPGALVSAVAAAESAGADLLSLFPAQAMGTPGERLMLPLLMHVLLGFLPLGLAETRPEPSLSAANGQFMLFRPAAYRAVGGHAACRADLVEDLALARAVKAAGRRLAVGDGTPWVTCRMYDGFGALWRGFRKNLYPAFGGRPAPFLAGWACLTALGAGPAVALAAGLAAGRPDVWAPGLAGLAAGWTGRALLARRLRQPGWSVLAHPIAVAVLGLLALESWRGWAFGQVAWKGRVYGRPDGVM